MLPFKRLRNWSNNVCKNPIDNEYLEMHCYQVNFKLNSISQKLVCRIRFTPIYIQFHKTYLLVRRGFYLLV